MWILVPAPNGLFFPLAVGAPEVSPILLAAGMPSKRALTLYQRFKREIIARQPQGKDWTLTINVDEWARATNNRRTP